MGFVGICLLGLVIVGLVVRGAIGRGKQVQALTQRGIATQAQVVRKCRKLVGSHRHEWAFRYRFSVEGREFDAQTLDVRDAFTHLEPGDTLDIYYLPENPSVSAPAWLVDEARSAVPT
ncbi:DUF3592 domain-containing protein [Manganibacter manganicus]|uniref:DUF3592 domain-containing protein n=1 Tax=Manganibacter manganicus TaxID=1873176 RepID=UPI0009BBA52D